MEEVLLALSQNFDGRFFKRHVGKFKIDGRWLCFGTPGQCDVYGWVRVNGVAVHFECEIKVFPDSPTKEQIRWKNLCKEQGVLYLLVSGPDTAVKRLKELCQKISS